MSRRTIDPHNPQHPQFRLGRETSDWLVRLLDTQPEPDDPYFDPLKRDEAFLEWLTRSPKHVQLFLEIRETYQRLGQIDSKQRIRIDELLQKTNADVIQLYGSPEPVPPKRTRRAAFGIAAALAALAVAGVIFWKVSGVQEYVTAIGEQRSFILEDGSYIYLNTDSHVKVDLSARQRHIALLRGEALFVVEHDAARPFIVSTSRANIRALGTQFNVRWRAESTEVTVVEGVVQVTAADAGAMGAELPASSDSPTSSPSRLGPHPSPIHAAEGTSKVGEDSPDGEGSSDVTTASLAAGEEVSIASGRLSKPAHSNVTEALAWRERRLAFQDTPLPQVAEEFNRYNSMQIRVEGPVAMRLTGVFDADRPNALLLYAKKQTGLVVEQVGDHWVIRPR